MSKANYFKVEKLSKEFNKAMKEGNLQLAQQINKQINMILYGKEEY